MTLQKRIKMYLDLRTVLINIKMLIRYRSKNPDYICLILRPILF